MLVKTYGSAVSGIDAFTVTMEVNISAGIKFFLGFSSGFFKGFRIRL